MEFKIDTKATYSVITPVFDKMDANLAVIIGQKCEEAGQSGSFNYIIDLQLCINMDEEAIPQLLQLHEDNYAGNRSLVFTGLRPALINTLKKKEADMLLNIAMTMQEAVDIISMEILERDLFNEES